MPVSRGVLAVSRHFTCVCCLALLLLCGLAGSAADAQPRGKPLPSLQEPSRLPSRPATSPSQLLLISLADGRLVAVDRSTGTQLWTFNTGAPLVSSTNRAFSDAAAGAGAKGSLDGSAGEEAPPTAAPPVSRESIFPGTDGSLYVYRTGPGEDGGADIGPVIERLPLTVPDLVRTSPAPALDGSLLMGSQHTTAFLLHAPTGRLLRTFYDFDGQLGQLDAQGLGLGMALDDPSVVVVGRKDFVVRSVHPELGEQWNVSWSQVSRLADLEAPQVDSTEGSAVAGAAALPGTLLLPPAAAAGSADAAAVAGAGGSDDLQLLVGEGFALQALQPGGWQVWQQQFGSPPLAAFAAHGGRAVDLLARTRQRQQLLLQPGQQPQMLGPADSSTPGSSQVMVQSLNGSLYAIPAWQITFGVGEAGSQCAARPPAGQPASLVAGGYKTTIPDSGRRPWSPHRTPPARQPQQPQQQEGSQQSTALALPQPGSSSWEEEEASRELQQCTEPEGDTCAVKPGIYTLSPRSIGGLLLLPSSANESGAAAAARQLQQADAAASSGAGGWVVLVLAGAAGGGSMVAAALLLVRRGRISVGKAASVTQQEDAVGATSGEEDAATSNGEKKAGKAGAKRRSNGKGSKQQNGGGSHVSNRVRGAVLQADVGRVQVERVPLDRQAHTAAQQDGEERSMPAAAAAAAPAGSSAAEGAVPERQHSLGPSSSAVQAGLAAKHGSSSAGSTQADSGEGRAAGGAAIRKREMKDGVALVGRMRVGPRILGYGSGGTIVFEGELDGRPVAIKRLLRQFYELARKEISALILSDEHPNIVRCFAMEEDAEFVYLALERCKCTLSDAMGSDAIRSQFVGPDGQPTAFAYRVTRDIGRGLAALHERGIVHRDLKPHNVLLTESGVAKLSDMGLSKRLVPEQSSFESVGSGGSSGWQAPEQLVGRSGGIARQTRAVDVFSFGLLLHYCLTGGRHPFGESFERDSNILMGRMTLRHLLHLPEAANVVKGACAAKPEARPPVAALLEHPLWWRPPHRLAFLIDVSDRVEGEDRAEDSRLYAALESLTEEAVGKGGSWAASLDSGLVNNLGKYRRYSYTSLRDLLRVIRNKHSHYREMPLELQRRVGPIPDGFLAYFTSRFPGLLLTCYFFALRWCAQEPVFQKYFPGGTSVLLETLAPAVARRPPPLPPAPAEPEPATEEAAVRGVEPARRGSGSGSVALLEAGTAQQQQQQQAPPSPLVAAEAVALLAGGSPGPARPGTAPSPQQLRAMVGVMPLLPQEALPPVGTVQDDEGSIALFPSRPGQPVCDFYQKTGHCQFGEACKFDHPPQYAVRLNRRGLPLRPGQQVCTFYERTGDCKFGPRCKFHHPNR